jgi:hypothetical protein
LDKKEVINPHGLGSGLKLWEQIASYPGTGAALIVLLACSNGRGGGDLKYHPMVGRWAGDRIAVVGDYAEDGDLPEEFAAGSIYKNSEGWLDITSSVAEVLEKELSLRFIGTGWKDVLTYDTKLYWGGDSPVASEAYAKFIEWENSLGADVYDEVEALINWIVDSGLDVALAPWEIIAKPLIFSRTPKEIVADLLDIREGKLTLLGRSHFYIDRH